MRLSVTAMLAAAVMFTVPGGCSKPYVRTLPWQGERVAREQLDMRAQAVRSVQAACTLTLTDARNERVNFDGALVVRLQDDQVWLRLRTWKLGQAVFDATVRPDGVWLMMSEQAAERMGAAPSPAGEPSGSTGVKSIRPDQIAEGWSLFMSRFFSDPGTRMIDRGGDTFEAERALEGGATVTAVVERATLTVREYRIVDEKGAVRQTLTFSQYRELGPDAIAFPMKIRASGPDGSAEVHLEDVELNGLIADVVFMPPRRAVKQ